MKTLIIIPAYNEEAAIRKVVENIRNRCPQYHYIIINDGSLDRTEQICKEQGFFYLTLPVNVGIAGAVQTGYKYAQRNGYDLAVQIDGDGQHDVGYISQMIAKMQEENADIAIGSRFIEKRGFQSSKARRTGIYFLSTLIKICTGKRIYDVTSGFRIVNRRFIEYYAQDDPGDYPEPEAIVMALESHAKILEYPVMMRERGGGTSSIYSWRSIYYMIKVSLAIIVCRLSLKIRR